MCDHNNFSQTSHRPTTAPNAPLTRPSLSEQCRSGNTQDGGTGLPIANLMADSESGSPDSYSSFLVTIRPSRLVSEIFGCDRPTGRQTTRIITIDGQHIVAGQLIIHSSPEKRGLTVALANLN